MKLKLTDITQINDFKPVEIHTFTLSADGNLLLAKENTPYGHPEPPSMFIWDMKQQTLLKDFKSDTYAVTFLPNNRLVLDEDGVLQIWDYIKEEKLQELRIDHLVDRSMHSCYDIVNDQRLLIYPGHWRAFYWDIKTNTYTFCNQPFTVGQEYEVSSNKNLLYIISQAVLLNDYEPTAGIAAPTSVQAVLAIDRNTGIIEKRYGDSQKIQANYTDGNYATNIALFEAQNLIVIGQKSGHIRAYDLENGKLQKTYQKKASYFQAMFKTCNNQIAAIGEYENFLTLWSLENETPETKVKLPYRSQDDEWDYPYYCISEDGRFLALLCERMNTVFVHDFLHQTSQTIEIGKNIQQMDMKGHNLYLLSRKGDIYLIEITH
jgi:WD40 repeat protein